MLLGYGGGTAQFQTDAAQADQLKYSKYLKRTLDTMADYIMPILIDQKDVVAGAIGELVDTLDLKYLYLTN